MVLGDLADLALEEEKRRLRGGPHFSWLTSDIVLLARLQSLEHQHRGRDRQTRRIILRKHDQHATERDAAEKDSGPN